MLLETVDASYWFLMPVLSCICLGVAIILAVSSSGGQRCCRRRQYEEDDVRWVADGQKCGGGNDDDDPTNAAAVEGDNIVDDDDDDDFLADIVTKMRPFSECHLRPYLYEPSHGEKSKNAVIAVQSFERDRNVVNALTEQMQHSKFAVVSSTGELLPKSVELKGSATTHGMHSDQSPVPAENQIQQQDPGTSPRDTYDNCSGRAMSGIYDDAVGCCMHASDACSVRTYAELNTSSSTDFSSGTATAASYACLINQKTESSYLNVCTSDLLLANGDQNVYNFSLSDSYNYTLPGSSTVKSDTPQPPAADDSIATRHDANAIWRSCESRRSDVESGHYSTLDKYDCNGAMMSGVYDSIEDPKYLTVCTTSPAATKQEHELKAKEKAEMEATKRKTMMHAAPIGETQLMKTTTNEVY